MADPLTYANSDEYVLVNPSDPKVGHLVYDAPMVDAETKQFIRDPETGKIKVYRMVIWGTKGLTQAQVEALITQKNATLVTRINNLDSTLTNFLDADDTSLDQLSELVAAIKANKIDIASLVTDIGKLIDPVSHLPIEATTASVGAVQLATATDIENGTANKVVDAKELINFAQTLPAVNGITDVSSGDNSNQLVVSRIGGSKTLTINNVEHASNADTATTANSVAWDNVSGRPSKLEPYFANGTWYIVGDDAYIGDHDVGGGLGLLGANGNTRLDFCQYGNADNYKSITFDGSTLHLDGNCNYANSAGSVAWDNVSGKPSSYTPSSHTHDDRYYTESEVNTLLAGKANSDHDHNRYGLYFNDICADTNTGWYESSYKGVGDDNQLHLYINDYFGIHFHTTGSFDVNGHAIISEGNIGSQSVNYANSAGNADTLDGYHHDSFPKVNSALFTVNGLSSPGWSAIGTGEGGSCIQVNTTDNTYPSICFHRSGYSHCVLAESGGQLGTMQQGSETFNPLITSANIGSQNVNYANSAGSVAWGNVSGRPDIWIG